MANQHSNKPILIARGGKLLPIYMEPPFLTGVDIKVGGCAPVTVRLDSVTAFCYFPASGDASFDGDALIVVTSGGLLCVDYKVPKIGVITDGRAHITTNLGGLQSFCYFPSGGVTLGGAAQVGEALKERGGKGVPRRKKIVDQRTIYYYDAHAYFENTLQLGGAAESYFRPAPYQFIKSLPKVSKPDPKRDSEFVDLFKKLLSEPQTTKFFYKAAGGITADGTADDEYFDFMNYIIANDEDLIISDVLSADGFPIITTVFDYTLEKQKREEDELFNILELL